MAHMFPPVVPSYTHVTHWLIPRCDGGESIPLDQQSLFGLCALRIAALRGYQIGGRDVPKEVAEEAEGLLAQRHGRRWYLVNAVVGTLGVIKTSAA